MGTATMWTIFKQWVGDIGWRLFLWALPMTEEQYREEIYLDVLRERSR